MIRGLVFQNLIPERGRKQYLDSTCDQYSSPCVFQNLIPERGRKHGGALAHLQTCSPSFSEPNPRKGTETVQSWIAKMKRANLEVFQNLIPERGRKLALQNT